MSLKDILKAYYDISYLLFLILFSLSHIQYFVQKERYIFPAIKITSRHKVTNKTNLDWNFIL